MELVSQHIGASPTRVWRHEANVKIHTFE